MPSRARLTQVSVETVGLRHNLFAESLTRAQCSSRSGVTLSNARAPSKTTEHNQAAWVRGPMIGTLPSCHLSSKYVQVFDQPPPTAIASPLEHFDHVAPLLNEVEDAVCLPCKEPQESV